MRNYNLFGLLILMCLFIASCSDDEGPTDPRLALEGTYEIEDIEVNISAGDEDTTLTLDINPEIEFAINSELGSDEMEVDPEEFIEDLFLRTFQRLGTPGFSVSIEFEDDDDLIAEISGTNFEIDGLEMDIIATNGIDSEIYPAKLEMEGEFTDTGIEFDYELVLAATEDVIFRGEATGEKE